MRANLIIVIVCTPSILTFIMFRAVVSDMIEREKEAQGEHEG